MGGIGLASNAEAMASVYEACKSDLDEPARPWDFVDVKGRQGERLEPSCGGKSNEEKDRGDARTTSVQQRVVRDALVWLGKKRG